MQHDVTTTQTIGQNSATRKESLNKRMPRTVFFSIFRIPTNFQKFHDRPTGRLTFTMVWEETGKINSLT